MRSFIHRKTFNVSFVQETFSVLNCRVKSIHAINYFQAFIFWVVDNFLKRKVFKTSPTNVALVTDASGGSDSSIKYHKASDKVSYYKNVADNTDSESDGLLSLDDVDTMADRSTRAGTTFHLIDVESSALEDAREDHGLLSAT